jgi:hypothetical protein
MRLRTISLFALMLLAAGCGRNEPVVVRDAPWYPLQVGCRWEYRGKGPKLIRQVVRHEKVGDYPCALIANLRGDAPARKEHVYANAGGVFLVAIEGRRLSSPLRILKLPPRAGESWKTDFKENDTLRKGLYVMDKEEVTVPAGTYRAITLRGEITDGGGGRTNVTYWFAEGVGMVKQLIRQDGQVAVYELERFDRP